MSLQKKAYDLLGVVSPTTYAVAKADEMDVSVPMLLAPGVAGGLVGLLAVPKHRVLGFIAGESIGMNAYRLYRGAGTDRTLALCNLGVAGSIVAGSLLMPKHPFFGGLAGFVVGVAATAMVPGSNASKLINKVK